MEKKVYWVSPLDKCDDFEKPLENDMIDGKTKFGPWAIMTPESWELYGCGKLGLGFGQRYKKQSDGKWLKVEG